MGSGHGDRSRDGPHSMNASEGPVLVAFDGSAAARDAVAAAAKLLPGRRVIVVTVWEEGLAYVASSGGPDMGMAPIVDPSAAREIDRGTHEHAERVASEGAQLARSLGLDAAALAMPDAGGVAHTILDHAREHRAAAIVIGSRGLSGLKARLEGSTSKAVSKHAACPVILVHETEADDKARREPRARSDHE